MVYRTLKMKYEDIESVRIPLVMPILYEIEWDGVTYEILVNHKPNCKKAVIFGTGAITKDTQLPVFSRATWMGQMSYTGIWYFDPTVYLGDLNIGWGYGTNRRWYLMDIAHLIRVFLEKLEINTENTLFFGSSGGGFTSILLATMFRSRATAINPQLSVRDYFPKAVQQLESVVLKSGDELLQERICAATFIKQNGYMPVVHLMENLLSTSDVQTHLHLFLSRLSEGKVDCSDRLRVDFYSAKGGHSAMPEKGACLRLIETDLNLPLPKPRDLVLESKPMEVAMTVDTKIEGERFVVRINADPVNEFTMYAYYLCASGGGTPLVKQGYIQSSRFEFELPESGSYFVRAFVKSKFSAQDDYTLINMCTEPLQYIRERAPEHGME